MQYLVSSILYIDSAEKLEGALRSVTDNGFPKKQLQVILIDSIVDDSTKKLCSDAALRGAEVIASKGLEVAEAYNLGLEKAEGEYVNFMLASSYLGDDFYRLLCDDASEGGYSLVSGHPYHENYLQKRERYTMTPKQIGPIDLSDDFKQFQTVLNAYLIRRSLINELRFDSSLHEEALVKFLFELMLKNGNEYYYDSEAEYIFLTALEDNTSTSFLQYHKWWYTDSLNNFYIPFLREHAGENGFAPKYIQYAAFYFIFTKYKCNLYDRNKFILKRNEYAEFYKTTCEALGLLQLGVMFFIKKGERLKMLRPLRFFLLEGWAAARGAKLEYTLSDDERVFLNLVDLKSGERVDLGYSEEYSDRTDLFEELTGLLPETEVTPETTYEMTPLKEESLIVTAMNHHAGNLEIDAFYTGADYLPEESISLFARLKGSSEKIHAVKTEAYPLLKCFGVTFKHKYPVHFTIPLGKIDSMQAIGFFTTFGGRNIQIRLKFPKPASRLLDKTRLGYWVTDGKMITYRGKTMVIRPENGFRKFWMEIGLMFYLLFAFGRNRKRALLCVFFRFVYWLMYPFYHKKHIWISFDKLYKAGDNGEYFYQYCRNQKDNIDNYYIVSKEAADYERLIKQDKKHVLIMRTWRCRLICLYAEAIMTTHANVAEYCGFTRGLQPFFRNLFNADVIFIQHGLTIQKIAQFQNRLFDNTRLYCCASPFERDNISKPIYDYSPEMLKMTGLARYDGLKSHEKKQILITPTWRKNVVNSNIAFVKKSHNEYFKNTTYFRIYNSLINDQRLIDTAREYGYKVIYLLHPNMSAQLEDFDKNDFVDVIPAAGDMCYEKILTESSLMVTDYSGVQFDFAYMRKPILYYHPDTLPPHYAAGGIDYDTMGFGPILKTHEEIIGALCDYMRSGCKTKPEYIKRADDFFAFSDFNSAKRIYDEVTKYLSDKKG